VNTLPFVLMMLLRVARPSLCALLLGTKADTALPEVTGWMSNNSWIVGECVIGLFVVIAASRL